MPIAEQEILTRAHPQNMSTKLRHQPHELGICLQKPFKFEESRQLLMTTGQLIPASLDNINAYDNDARRRALMRVTGCDDVFLQQATPLTFDGGKGFDETSMPSLWQCPLVMFYSHSMVAGGFDETS